MTWTALKVVDNGVLLYDEHLRRLSPAGTEILRRFQDFARSAQAGSYRLEVKEGELLVSELPGSTLVDDAPVRFRISPYWDKLGAFPKPDRPNAYSDLRVPGVVTLLTSAKGTEIFESCAASILGWDGTRIVLPPEDRPRVDSVTERHLARWFDVVRSPIRVDDERPLLLANALKGTSSVGLERPPFPAEVRARIEKAFLESARRS